MNKLFAGFAICASFNASAIEFSPEISHTYPTHLSPLEVDGSVPNGAVVVGMGFRGVKGKVTTMQLDYRFIDSQGKLGALYSRKYGSEPNHGLEVYVVCGADQVVTRAAVRFTDNDVRALALDCNNYDSDTMTINPNISSTRKSLMDGRDAYEIDWATYSHADTDLNSTFITGFGMREYKDNITHIQGKYRVLNP